MSTDSLEPSCACRFPLGQTVQGSGLRASVGNSVFTTFRALLSFRFVLHFNVWAFRLQEHKTSF